MYIKNRGEPGCEGEAQDFAARPPVLPPRAAEPKEVGGAAEYLEWTTIGGVGNQRECIIGSVITAYHGGFSHYVLPRVYPVYHGHQEVGQSGRNDYVPPWNDRSKWADFGMIFNTTHFIGALKKLGITAVVRPPSGLATISFSVTKEDYFGPVQPKLAPPGTIFNAPAKMKEFFDLKRGGKRIPSVWRKTGGAENMCYEYFTSRGENPNCRAFGEDICHAATAALIVNDAIAVAAATVTSRLQRRARKESGRRVVWHALHARTFFCRVQAKHFEDWFTLIAQPHHKPGVEHWLYLITDLSPDSQATAGIAPYYASVVRKEDAMPQIRHNYPFEAFAQIDFEVGYSIADVYFADPHSSSDNFTATRRIQAGKKVVWTSWKC